MVGVQGLVGGGPIAGAFGGGGVNVGVNNDGQFFVQFQASGGIGLGLFGGVGVQGGRDKSPGKLSSGVSTSDGFQVNANVGLFESVGVSANVNDNLKLTGGSVAPLPKVGIGLGAEVSVQRVRTTTIATRPVEWVKKLIQFFER